jgi:choline dehydrogenase/5-(hydroxymethyl)furfural/furfural oxidase
VSGATVIAQAVASGAVEIITADATRVVIEDNVVRSVATSSGEVPVDVVILTAGAVFTPLLLRQSGVVHGEIGQRAQDHPSIFFTVARPRDFVGGVNATAVHSMGDTQLIAYESAHPSTPMFGGVSLSMLRVTSRGEVSGTLQSPQLQLRLLSNDNDRALMRSAVRDFVREYVPVIERECGSVLCDALGTPAQHLATLNDPSLDAWLLAHVVPHSHIAGTCSMGGGPGAPVTQRGEVQGVRGLYVADASVFPQLPRSNTNKVVAAVASQIAHFVAEDLS